MKTKWCYSLREAARMVGCHHYTLRLWLLEIGVDLPSYERGRRAVVPWQVVDRLKAHLLRKRGPVERLSLLRAKGKVA